MKSDKNILIGIGVVLVIGFILYQTGVLDTIGEKTGLFAVSPLPTCTGGVCPNNLEIVSVSTTDNINFVIVIKNNLNENINIAKQAQLFYPSNKGFVIGMAEQNGVHGTTFGVSMGETINGVPVTNAGQYQMPPLTTWTIGLSAGVTYSPPVVIETSYFPGGIPDSYMSVISSSTATQIIQDYEIYSAPDADGDGVPDASDLCPNTPTGTEVDSTGCPIPLVCEEYIDSITNKVLFRTNAVGGIDDIPLIDGNLLDPMIWVALELQDNPLRKYSYAGCAMNPSGLEGGFVMMQYMSCDQAGCPDGSTINGGFGAPDAVIHTIINLPDGSRIAEILANCAGSPVLYLIKPGSSEAHLIYGSYSDIGEDSTNPNPVCTKIYTPTPTCKEVINNGEVVFRTNVMDGAYTYKIGNDCYGVNSGTAWVELLANGVWTRFVSSGGVDQGDKTIPPYVVYPYFTPTNNPISYYMVPAIPSAYINSNTDCGWTPFNHYTTTIASSRTHNPVCTACVSGQCAPQTCTPNWQCTAWSSCVGGTQSRVCTDANACGVLTGKPAESQACGGGLPPYDPCTQNSDCQSNKCHDNICSPYDSVYIKLSVSVKNTGNKAVNMKIDTITSTNAYIQTKFAAMTDTKSSAVGATSTWESALIDTSVIQNGAYKVNVKVCGEDPAGVMTKVCKDGEATLTFSNGVIV